VETAGKKNAKKCLKKSRSEGDVTRAGVVRTIKKVGKKLKPVAEPRTITHIQGVKVLGGWEKGDGSSKKKKRKVNIRSLPEGTHKRVQIKISAEKKEARDLERTRRTCNKKKKKKKKKKRKKTCWPTHVT